MMRSFRITEQNFPVSVKIGVATKQLVDGDRSYLAEVACPMIVAKWRYRRVPHATKKPFAQ